MYLFITHNKPSLDEAAALALLMVFGEKDMDEIAIHRIDVEDEEALNKLMRDKQQFDKVFIVGIPTLICGDNIEVMPEANFSTSIEAMEWWLIDNGSVLPNRTQALILHIRHCVAHQDDPTTSYKLHGILDDYVFGEYGASSNSCAGFTAKWDFLATVFAGQKQKMKALNSAIAKIRSGRVLYYMEYPEAIVLDGYVEMLDEAYHIALRDGLTPEICFWIWEEDGEWCVRSVPKDPDTDDYVERYIEPDGDRLPDGFVSIKYGGLFAKAKSLEAIKKHLELTDFNAC